MGARRFDPDRKQRILDAAIEVIAEHGVANTTHRLIAAAADVPLGSLTYHFSGLEELRALAFRQHAQRLSVSYAGHFDGVETPEQLVDAVTSFIHGDTLTTQEWVVSYELYLAALRDPALREVTETWMRESRAVLARFVDAATARGLDALIEGLLMHRALSTSPMSRKQIRDMVQRVIAGAAQKKTLAATSGSAPR